MVLGPLKKEIEAKMIPLERKMDVMNKNLERMIKLLEKIDRNTSKGAEY